MSIERLSSRDVADVAALHGEALTGLLTRLGPRARQAYYAACATSPIATGFVARDSHGLEGFVLGSTTPEAVRRDVLRREPLRLAAGIAAGVVRRPANAWWLLRSLGGPDSGHYDSTVPELVYLAVSPSRRGRGIGRRLVEAFASALRAEGQTRFELSVDEDNRDAAAFYERLGFTPIGAYREFGRLHVRYEMTLASATNNRDQ